MKRILTLLVMLMGIVGVQAQEKLMSDGVERNMIVYAPKNIEKNRPLLISMHGMNQDAAYQKNQANYEAVADTAKFVVVYPDGIDRGWDLGSMKDINFITNIIDEMVKRYSIDRNRVYLSGFSMGGMMTYYAMTKIADKIAAFAPVSGYNMGGPNATSSRPVPIIHVHGTSDDVCSYSPVQSHIDAWVKRNGCSASAREELPKTGPSNTSARIYRYLNGEGGVEVAHLKLPGKGHWHSNDPAVAMTNIEIWNFCKRYSLTPGPELVKAVPEDNSFDMTKENSGTFELTFDKPVVCSKVKGNLIKGTTIYSIKLQETGESNTLTYLLPSTTTLAAGEYTLNVSGVTSSDGGMGSNVSLKYTYGIEEVGEELKIDTLWTQDWWSQREAVGEGIPYGWERENTKSDGSSSDKKTSGAKDCGGARLKYFVEGGDINAGFYLSAREFDKVTFTYGTTANYALSIPAGKYNLNVPSIYWTQGAKDAGSTFSAYIRRKSDNKALASAPSLTPTGCMADNANQQVKNSALHVIPFNLTATTPLVLEFSMAAGWNGIIVGEPYITTRPSYAQIYKGGFLRALGEAKRLLDVSDGKEGYAEQAKILREAIEKYDTFTSISPSEYEAATKALQDAMKPLIPLGIKPVVGKDRQNIIYDMMGRRIIGSPSRGIYIINGKKTVVK
ncbi:MAG: hypothetical protein MJZ12_00755 [Prevotella sp.]|nr:hypothetical protein [Prevotella sp.]